MSQQIQKEGWSVKTWGNAAGDLSRATVNRLIAANKIDSVVRGGRRNDHETGKPLHCCCVCGKLHTRPMDWAFFGSVKDIDDFKTCSEECRTKAVNEAINIAQEALKRAYMNEYRHPFARDPAANIQQCH